MMHGAVTARGPKTVGADFLLLTAFKGYWYRDVGLASGNSTPPEWTAFGHEPVPQPKFSVPVDVGTRMRTSTAAALGIGCSLATVALLCGVDKRKEGQFV